MSVILVAPSLSAQGLRDQLENHFKPYGFFRTFAYFDSRESVTSNGGLFYYLPMDKEINLQGKDIYYNPAMKMSSITTRMGLDMSGYQYGSLKISGKVEADFSLLNGSTASLRMRQAYARLLWDDLGYSDYSLSLLVGQAWNPMAADQPYCINVEAGSPFNPFARSPQLLLEAEPIEGLTISAAAIYPTQYLPTGPDGPSENYIKYGLLPELYVGATYSYKGFMARLGADFISLRPRTRATYTGLYTEKGTPVEDRISMLSPMVYLQYEDGDFKVNAKSVFASGGDHLRLMGGYALYDRADPYDYEYTPLRSSVSYLSFSVGRKWQFMCMLGYMKAFGTADKLPLDYESKIDESSIYYFEDGFKNVNQMARVTPTVAFNAGKLTVALEYNNTCVQYGDINSLNEHALCPSDLHWIINHRLQAVFKFYF